MSSTAKFSVSTAAFLVLSAIAASVLAIAIAFTESGSQRITGGAPEASSSPSALAPLPTATSSSPSVAEPDREITVETSEP